MRMILGLFCAAMLLPAQNFAGKWMGELNVGAQKLRLGIDLTSAPAEKGVKWSGTIISIDQDPMPRPADDLLVEGKQLSFRINLFGVSYLGTMNEKGDAIEGTFEQNGRKIPLALTRVNSFPNPFARPQEPKPPFPYRSEEVVFDGSSEGVKLSGTLSLPNGKGPFPAVVLISGSGPQNRDEELFQHKPFLLLADHLTRKGIAVLRYDDRGAGKSTGSHFESSIAELAGDAARAWAFLQQRPEVDKKRCGMLGHSEGALHAWMSASKEPGIAFIVSIAGMAEDGLTTMLRQKRALLGPAGVPPPIIEEAVTAQREALSLARETQTPPDYAQKVEALLRKDPMGARAPEQMIKNGVRELSMPWLRSFLRVFPAEHLRLLTMPMMALNGSLDTQVDSRANLDAIRKAFQEGGNPRLTVREYPGLNHLLQTAKTGQVNEYQRITETMAPAVLADISDWISQLPARK
jgi:uncharacterized protein